MTAMQNNARWTAVPEAIQGHHGGVAIIKDVQPATAVDKAARLCDHLNRVQEKAAKVSEILESKIASLHGPTAHAGQNPDRPQPEGPGVLEQMVMKVNALEGMINRLGNLANQI